MIVTCPKYEVKGGQVTSVLSPLAGQALIANLMPGRFGVIATPAADRIARGEEWHQTNTLDGQKAHDSFIRIGEPSFFQEFGPAGYHVTIGFANPAIIQGRLAGGGVRRYGCISQFACRLFMQRHGDRQGDYRTYEQNARRETLQQRLA